jgi:hypothetical protein
MRASDIGGVGGPAATPALGTSAAALAPVVAAVASSIGGGSSVDNINSNKTQHLASTVVAQWFKLLLIIHKVLGSIPVSYIFESD